MSRPSLRLRLLAAGTSAFAMTAALPAMAEAPVETAIRSWVSALDASPNWVAGFAELSYDERRRAITVRNLTIRSETLSTKLELSFGTLGVTGYDETSDGGFEALEITADDGKFVLGDVADVSMRDIRIDKIEVPSFANFVFDPARAFTSGVKAMAIAAKTSIDGIRIGNIQSTQTSEGETSRADYGSYQLTGMADGKIEHVTLGPITQEMPAPDGLMSFAVERVEARKYDLDAVIAVFDPDRYVGGVGDGTWRTVLGLEVYKNFTINVPGAAVRIGSFETENLRMRQPKRDFGTMIDAILARPDMPEEEMGQLVMDNMAGLLGFVGVGALRLNDLDITAPEIERFHLGDFHINDLSSDGIGEIGIRDLDAAAQDKSSLGAGRLAIGDIRFGDLDLLAQALKDDSADFNPRPLIPTLGFAEAVDVDVVQAGEKLGSIDRARIDLGAYIGPIPTQIATDIRGLDLDVSQVSDRRARQMLRDLGYQRLVADYGLSLAWREADESVKIDGPRLAIKDLATLTLDATLTGLSRQAIEAPEKLEPALTALLFTGGSLAIQDQSIVDRAIGMQAGKMKVEPDKFRQQFAGALPLLLMALRNPGFQGKLAPALQAFIKTPGTMTITANPTTPVPVMQLVDTAETAPQKLPDLLQVEIKTTP